MTATSVGRITETDGYDTIHTARSIYAVFSILTFSPAKARGFIDRLW